MVRVSLPRGASSIDHTEMPTVPSDMPIPNMSTPSPASPVLPISDRHSTAVPAIYRAKKTAEPRFVPKRSNAMPLTSFATVRHAPLTATSVAACSAEKPSEVNSTAR